MHLTTMQLIFVPRWIFNILMCPLANNWPPQYYAHYYAAAVFGPRWIFNVLMCLANNWPPPMHLTTMQLIFWSKVDIQHFYVSSCQQLASSYYASLLCNLWSKGGYSTF
jgi:hypothetical protein